MQLATSLQQFDDGGFAPVTTLSRESSIWQKFRLRNNLQKSTRDYFWG